MTVVHWAPDRAAPPSYNKRPVVSERAALHRLMRGYRYDQHAARIGSTSVLAPDPPFEAPSTERGPPAEPYPPQATTKQMRNALYTMAVHGRLYLKVVFRDLLMGRTTLCDSGKLIFGFCAHKRQRRKHNISVRHPALSRCSSHPVATHRPVLSCRAFGRALSTGQP